MNWKIFGFATLSCVVAAPVFAAPDLSIIPGGVQAANWVWNIDITPDLTDIGGTPVAVELGFRLTGGQLLSATLADPIAFDTPLSGRKIFGWEPSDPLDSSKSFGLQMNLTTGEIFAAYGSVVFTNPGPQHFLQVTTTGPSSGALSSTIQWLGAHGVGDNQGRITQVTGFNGTTYQTTNYDIFAGSATQPVPEPITGTLLAMGAILTTLGFHPRRFAHGRHC